MPFCFSIYNSAASAHILRLKRLKKEKTLKSFGLNSHQKQRESFGFRERPNHYRKDPHGNLGVNYSLYWISPQNQAQIKIKTFILCPWKAQGVWAGTKMVELHLEQVCFYCFHCLHQSRVKNENHQHQGQSEHVDVPFVLRKIPPNEHKNKAKNRGNPDERKALFQQSREYKGLFHPAFLTRCCRVGLNKRIPVKLHFLPMEMQNDQER